MVVVNPLFRKDDKEDVAYNCRCICNVELGNKDDGKAWTWLPWNSCGCACNSTTANRTANKSLAQSY